jgi:hypothetical protein
MQMWQQDTFKHTYRGPQLAVLWYYEKDRREAKKEGRRGKKDWKTGRRVGSWEAVIEGSEAGQEDWVAGKEGWEPEHLLYISNELVIVYE